MWIKSEPSPLSFSLPHDVELQPAMVAATEMLALFLAAKTTTICSVIPLRRSSHSPTSRIGNPIGKFKGNVGVCWGRTGYHLGNRFPTIHAALLIFYGVPSSHQIRFRKPLLYPTELRGHSQISMSCCSTGSRSWGQVFPVCSSGSVFERSASPQPSHVPSLHHAVTVSAKSPCPAPTAPACVCRRLRILDGR